MSLNEAAVMAVSDRVAERPAVDLFSTCPSMAITSDNYLERVIRVASWSERAGCTGILIYADNAQVDPWLVAQVIIQSTRTICPLVAVQPVYMHPYSVAKIVATIGFLHGRRVYLNMIAGGFRNDLAALDDTTPHDNRYERLIEYTHIICRLLENSGPVTVDGQFYRVRGLSLSPSLPAELFPGILGSGSSEAGLAAAKAMKAIPVKYPEPPGQCSGVQNSACGLRIGILARPDEDEAWSIALRRFPEDRRGALTHQLAMKVSDSAWHKRLSEVGRKTAGRRGTYWLHPFETSKTYCPYLVGSYESVASELVRYIAAGFQTYILDIPASEEEFEHVRIVFQMASASVS